MTFCSSPQQLFGQAVMVMRAYVFSERSPIVLAILLSGYGALVGAVTYLFLTDVPLPILNPSSPMHLLGKSGCFPDYSEKSFGLRIGLALVAAMLVDSLNLLVVSFYSWKRSRYGRSKLTCFFSKQGLNVFVWMTVSNVITLALYFSQDNGIGVPFVLVISNIFACRIILQLRSGSWQTSTQLSRDNSQMIRDALAKLPPQDEWAVSIDVSAEDDGDTHARRSGSGEYWHLLLDHLFHRALFRIRMENLEEGAPQDPNRRPFRRNQVPKVHTRARGKISGKSTDMSSGKITMSQLEGEDSQANDFRFSTSTMSSLVIPLVSGALPTCRPNLMPFHINYDGLAPVSTFMRVSPLKQGESPSEAVVPAAEETGTAENASADAMNVDSNAAAQPEPTPTSSTLDASTTQPTDVDMENATSNDSQAPRPAITRSSTESTLVVDSQASSSTSISSTYTLQKSAAPLPPLPVLEEIEKRVVSSFRGRTIHGLSLDLPLGYSGLLLESEGDANATSPAKPETKEKDRESEKSTKGKGKTKAKAAPKAGNKPRGRLARSAAPRKPEVIEIEDVDVEMPEASVSLQNTQGPADDTEPAQEAPLTRSLVPKAQFSSFTLWHADRPVEKTRDEYFRALEEWIALSHEIHRTDITFED
ncbi:hypothetical protein NLJ89_g1893 [Agrocybe chaxingu]|uniref:Uncharacterized protein n=1 Tax=Agrocybe chaxingu TaxID=84603 RepID=A0A9W8MZ65_9AGAR|nr:hypothetical protein NLJ89_g1893 [Agrocybe chaxingu]